jgi:hypothetical protein
MCDWKLIGMILSIVGLFIDIAGVALIFFNSLGTFRTDLDGAVHAAKRYSMSGGNEIEAITDSLDRTIKKWNEKFSKAFRKAAIGLGLIIIGMLFQVAGQIFNWI